MTTREFINKRFYLETNKTFCSSVFSDSEGNLYSYGYHYPLLFQVGLKTIRNVRGYSNTTARHILWSRDIDAIDIVVPRGYRISEGLEPLIASQREHVNELHKQLDSKKRKDTQVYRQLEDEFLQAFSNLKRLQV